MKSLETIISASIATKQRLLADTELLAQVQRLTQRMIETFQADGKVFWCGNGGSAADAQHLAAELSGRFYLDRRPLFSETLHGNASYLTAVANDYSFDHIYARLIQALGRPGDMLIGLSTSGNSPNVVLALQQARQLGLTTVAMTGEGGGAVAAHSEFLIQVPSADTPRIQECHLLLGHAMCEQIEATLFGSESP